MPKILKHFLRILVTFFFLLLIINISACAIKKNTANNHSNKAKSYLEATQDKNGSWDPNKFEGNFSHQDGTIAMTALAAMALLHQNNQQNNETISRAIHFLITKQNKEGLIGERNYANGVAFYFLSCAYRNKVLKDEEAFEKFIKAIMAKKNNLGAWDYTEANTDRNDMSISVWMCLAFNELLYTKKYSELANETLKNINSFINRDSKGAGDNSLTTKAVAAYTYGENPDSPSGKVMRSPGSTGQALILFIKSTQKDLATSNWVSTALKDQETNLRLNVPNNNTLPFCLYKVFFLINAHKNGAKLNDETLVWLQTQITKFQSKDGAWSPSSPAVQFGGKTMATSLALLILANQ